MEASHLKIGNFVLSYGTNGNPDEWVEIKVNAEHIKTCLSQPFLFKPIPLTHERLVNEFGFIHNQRRCTYTLGNFVIMNWSDEGYILPQYEPIYDEDVDKPLAMKPFNAIHELQNICLFIKGIELI